MGMFCYYMYAKTGYSVSMNLEGNILAVSLTKNRVGLFFLR